MNFLEQAGLSLVNRRRFRHLVAAAVISFLGWLAACSPASTTPGPPIETGGTAPISVLSRQPPTTTAVKTSPDDEQESTQEVGPNSADSNESRPAMESRLAPAVAQPGLSIVPLLFDEIGLYQLVELEILSAITAENPFDPAELDIRVTFSPESGQEIEIGAFWYQAFNASGRFPVGEPGWRARFAPTKIGRWTVVASIPKLAMRSEAVAFQVLPSDNPGFVRINPTNPRYFAFDNGDFFFPIGMNFAWWSGAGDALSDYGRWLDLFAANGGNAARIWMADWSFAIEWNDTPLGDYRQRLRQAWLLDQIFSMAEEKDIYVMLVLLNCADFNNWQTNGWNRNPYNEENGGPLALAADFLSNETARDLLKRRLNYITNRYGYATHLLAWEWWNEVNLAPFVDEMLLPWIREMSAYLDEHDPNKHLVTNSYAILDASPTFAMPEIDIIQKHEYALQVETPTKDIADRVVADFRRLVDDMQPKPALLGEFGYGTEGDGTDLEQSGIHLHNGLWATTFAGYAGTGFYWYWDTYVEYYQAWNHFHGISQFVMDVDLSRYEPFSPLAISDANGQPGGAIGLGLSGDDILIWLRNDRYTVDAATYAYFARGLPANSTYLPPPSNDLLVTVPVQVDGRYTVHWFDPQTGNWASTVTAEAQDYKLTVTVPAFRRDIAARIALTP